MRDSLIDMHCKCGKTEASLVIFDSSSQSINGSIAKTIQWGSMITGFVRNGMDEEALKLFSKMLQGGDKGGPIYSHKCLFCLL